MNRIITLPAKWSLGLAIRFVKLTLLVSPFVGVIVYFDLEKDKKNTAMELALAPFNASVSRYLETAEESKRPLHVSKKFVHIDGKTKRVLPFGTSPSSQNYSENDVETAVVQDCEYTKVATYTNGAAALQEECRVHIIDVKTRTWSFWGEVKWSMPSEEIRRRRGSTSDEKGGSAMIEFWRRAGPYAKAQVTQGP